MLCLIVLTHRKDAALHGLQSQVTPMDSEATGTEEYSKNNVVSWIRETSGVPWARQKEPQSLHVNTGSFLLLPPFYRQQKELCDALCSPCRNSVVSTDSWGVMACVRHHTQGQANTSVPLRYHWPPRRYQVPLPPQQHPRHTEGATVAKKQFSGLDTKVSKANCAMENHIPWKDPCKDEEEWNRSLWKPSTAIAGGHCSLQMEDLTPSCWWQETGKEVVVRVTMADVSICSSY